MWELIAVIFKNFFGYDMIIFIAAGFTGFIFYRLLNLSDKLHGMLNHNIFVADIEHSRRQVDKEISELSEEKLMALRDRINRFYSLYVNLTAIFPLLGILGTVISLLGLVSDISNVAGNFYGALTSTFWGLIFAITFKFLDGFISPKIEINEKSVEMYFNNRTQPTDETAVADVQVSGETVSSSSEISPEPTDHPQPENRTINKRNGRLNKGGKRREKK